MYRLAPRARPRCCGPPAAASAAPAARPRPAGCCCALSPGALGPHGARAGRGLAAGLGHERQDHHLGDARRLPRARRAAGGPQPRRARTWPGAWPPRCSTPAASAGQLGLFEVDEAWLPSVAEQVEPRAAAALEPVPRPARPLRRARAARRPLGRAGRAPATAARASCSTPTTRWSPTSGASAQGVTYFGVEDDSQALPGMQHAADSKHCRNCGARLRLRGDLPRPHGPLPLPQLRPRAARRRRSPPRACSSTA